jgi:hypothetical protein
LRMSQRVLRGLQDRPAERGQENAAVSEAEPNGSSSPVEASLAAL